MFIGRAMEAFAVDRDKALINRPIILKWLFSCAVIASLANLVTGQIPTCTGLAADGHCYELIKSQADWQNASDYCARLGGHLASAYTWTEQTNIENYLTAEQFTAEDIWTSGKLPKPEIFWGNPQQLWRWVGVCGEECSQTGCNGGRLDLAFLIDASGSMAEGNGWELTIRFFQSILGKLDIGDDRVRVALVRYSDKDEDEQTKIQKYLVDVAVPNAQYDIETKLQNMQYLNGKTDTDDAIKVTIENVFKMNKGDRSNAPNVIIILTDGQSTDTESTLVAARDAKDSGIQIFSVGVAQMNVNEVKLMSSEPQDNGITYFLVSNFTDLNVMVTNVSTQVCRWHSALKTVNITAIGPQGCYNNIGEEGLLTTVSINIQHASNCTYACAQRGYLYAGVGFTNQNPWTPTCRCGNEFGKGGAASPCTRLCPGATDNNNFCGDIERNLVFKTDGGYGLWEQSEPNNMNDNTNVVGTGEQYCGALDSNTGTVYPFVDELCTRTYTPICDVPAGYCTGALTQVSGHRYFNISVDINIRCVSIGVRDNERRTWHNSRRFCQNQNGDLVRIGNLAENVKITATIQAVRSQNSRGDRYFWAGLYKESHFWMAENVVEFNWMNFAVEEPRFSVGDCVYMDHTAAYTWRTANCSARKYFVCDTVSRWFTKPHSTTSTTTTTTTRITTASTSTTDTNTTDDPQASATTTTTNTTAQKPGGATTNAYPEDTTTLDTTTLVGPDAEKSANETKTWIQKYWWLILLICLLLVLLIILLIVFFCCYKRAKVHPRIYDARPIAKAPISTVLGDTDPYDYFVESSSQVDLVVGSTLHGRPKKKQWNRVISSYNGRDVYYDTN